MEHSTCSFIHFVVCKRKQNKLGHWPTDSQRLWVSWWMVIVVAAVAAYCVMCGIMYNISHICAALASHLIWNQDNGGIPGEHPSHLISDVYTYMPNNKTATQLNVWASFAEHIGRSRMMAPGGWLGCYPTFLAFCLLLLSLFLALFFTSFPRG